MVPPCALTEFTTTRVFPIPGSPLTTGSVLQGPSRSPSMRSPSASADSDARGHSSAPPPSGGNFIVMAGPLLEHEELAVDEQRSDPGAPGRGPHLANPERH